ncbi:2-alkyl-3-oxoalkanoate reductase [subsurface metagenome]
MCKVLITGAAGFIGSHVTRHFCEKGLNPLCYVKKTSDTKFIWNLPVQILYGDILDLEGLKNAMKNVDTVIHIAALSKDWGRYNDFYNINVEGTLNVLRAGTARGVKHFIITGTISSYGEENSSQIKNESFPFNSHYPYFMDRLFPSKMNYYRDTKALSTKQAIEYANSKNLNLTIIEPVWVYGEHEFHTGFYDYMKTAKSGIPFLPGSKKNKFHVIYVRDLAQAYYLAYIKRPARINRFIIGNKKPVYMDSIYELFCSEMGVRKPGILPKSLVYPFAFIMELLYTILAVKHPPLLTRGRVNMLYDNIEYSTRKAQEELLFVNKYCIEEGIKNTVQWYKQNQLI